MEDTSSHAYFLESIRLALGDNERNGIGRWASAFLQARDRGMFADSKILLSGIKRLGYPFGGYSRGVIAHCGGLWMAWWGTREKAETSFREGIDFLQAAGARERLTGIYNDLGTLYFHRSAWHDAIEAYHLALRFLPESELAPEMEAMVRNNLGVALYRTGDMQTGFTEIEQAAHRYDDLGERGKAARVRVNLGLFLEEQGQTDEALVVLEGTLTALRAVGDTRVLGEALNSVGVLYRYRGEWHRAEGYHLESLEIAQSVNDIAGKAQTMSNLGVLEQVQGHYGVAKARYTEALAMYADIHDVQGLAIALTNIGHIESLEGDDRAALLRYTAALAHYRQVGDAQGETKALLHIAVAYRDLNEFEQAEQAFVAAYGRTIQNPTWRVRDRVLAAFGFFRGLQQRWAEAEVLLREALALQAARHDFYAQAETIYKLAWLKYQQGAYEDVLPVLEPGWTLVQEHGHNTWLIQMALLLADTCEAVQSPEMFRYYTIALVTARREQIHHWVKRVWTKLHEFLDILDAAGQYDMALHVVQEILDLWRMQDWEDVLGEDIVLLEGRQQALLAKSMVGKKNL